MVKPPVWYWITVALILLWSLLGCYACFTQLTMSAEALAKLPPMQRDAWVSMTLAPKAAYVIGVLAGIVGAALLLGRRGLARAAFLISLIGVVVQFGWFFLVWHGWSKLGPSSAIFPLVIALIAVAEIEFAGYAIKRRWIA